MAWFDDTAKVVTFFANIGVNIVPPIFGTNILGFLNPAIVDHVWGLTLIGMPIVASGFYVFSLPRPDGSARIWPAALAIIMFLVSAGSMLAIRYAAISFTPATTSFLLHVLVVVVFLSAGAGIGSGLARVPPLFSKTP
jgi:hypothetical protein